MTGWDPYWRVIPVEFLLIMHALPPRLPNRGQREIEATGKRGRNGEVGELVGQGEKGAKKEEERRR